MKTTESEEERYDFKNAVKGHRGIPVWLTFLLSLTPTTVIKTKLRFQEATDLSRAEPVKSFSTDLKNKTKKQQETTVDVDSLPNLEVSQF